MRMVGHGKVNNPSDKSRNNPNKGKYDFHDPPREFVRYEIILLISDSA